MKAILIDDIDTILSNVSIRVDMNVEDEERHRIEEEFITFSNAVREILSLEADRNTP